MENVRDALLRMYRAAKDLKKLHETLKKSGFNDDPIFDAMGNTMDAIYYIIGEDTFRFEDSITYLVFNTPSLDKFSDEEIVDDILMPEFLKNYSQPKPNVIKANFTDVFRKMYKASGGYLSTTPEGEWK